MTSRRHFLLASTAALVTGRRLFAEPPVASPVIVVYKDPGCECCAKWVKHLSANGFVVTVHDSADVDQIKREMRVPAALQSCHTAVVGRYVIEGHVPADLIKKLIAEKSTASGLAVPGMVEGSPGMEGSRTEHYDVIAFDSTGKTRVYAKR